MKNRFLLGALAGALVPSAVFSATLTNVPMQGGMIMPMLMYHADHGHVAAQRHAGRANYNFVDGHAQARRFTDTWDRARAVDAWHPLFAQ